MLDAETKVIVKYYSQKERILDPTSERATKLERIKLLERGEVIIGLELDGKRLSTAPVRIIRKLRSKLNDSQFSFNMFVRLL